MAQQEKKRLDVLLFEKKMAQSRQRSQALILSGRVMVDHQPVDKPGTLVPADANIRLKGDEIPFVSRGGLKLEHALNEFQINLERHVCMDVGASTGGFTDCMLQHGAKQVFAVDVGYGQLAWKIRNDSRVTVLERTNIRYLRVGALPCPVDTVTIDVSFISLKIVVPAVLPFMKKNARIIALIKPQFEVGKGKVGKGGVVRQPDLQKQVLDALSTFFKTLSFTIEGIIPSPILGAKGNKEFLVSMHL